MRLTTKTGLFLSGTVTALTVALYFALKLTVVQGFTDAERSASVNDVRRVVDVVRVLSDDFAGTQCPDYAYWTDLAEFTGGRGDAEWADENLTFDGFRSLGWAFVAVYDAQGPGPPRERFSMMVDPHAEAPKPLTPAVRSFIQSDLLAGASRHADPIQGLARIDGRTYLVASLPTKTSEMKRARSPGRFVAAKRVDEPWVARLEQYTALKLAVSPLDEPAPDPLTARARVALASGKDVVIETPSAAEVDGFATLEDLHGQPLLTLRVKSERTAAPLGATVLRSMVMALVGGGVLLLVLASALLGATVLRPLSRLLMSVRQLEAGELERVPVWSRDEVGQLGVAFNQMAETLLERQRALDRALAELWGEMDLAKRIQTALLPPRLQAPDLAVERHMETAAEVGGDYCDVIDSRVGYWIAIGDVSGHGVTAGLVMMIAHTAIRTAILHEIDTLEGASSSPSPSRVLATANRILLEDVRRLGTDKYLTVLLLHRSGPGRFVHAGKHLDPLVYRRASDTVEWVPTGGMWLGVTADIERHLTDAEFEIAVGDVVLLYTDGVVEAMKDGSPFGVERLRQVVASAAREGGAAAVRDAVAAALAEYARDDDVTFLVVERPAAPG